jgi:hypothetical protein
MLRDQTAQTPVADTPPSRQSLIESLKKLLRM